MILYILNLHVYIDYSTIAKAKNHGLKISYNVCYFSIIFTFKLIYLYISL